MNIRLERLDEAIERVDQEQKRLQREKEAFEEFREVVGRTPMSHTGNRSRGMGGILETYRKQVFEALDYGEVYGESCEESISSELSPSLAETLTEKQPLNHERKRDLLLAANGAIDSRTALYESMAQERDSLERIYTDLTDVDSTLSNLPSCSLQQLSFEEFVDVWESSENLICQCDTIAEARQSHLQQLERNYGNVYEREHSFNEFLYAGLETRFPALRTITEMRQSIERYRQGPCVSTDDQSDCETGPVVAKGPLE